MQLKIYQENAINDLLDKSKKLKQEGKEVLAELKQKAEKMIMGEKEAI